MEIDKTYFGRHGFVDFENKTFKITNGKDNTTIDCDLLKVPNHTFKNTYHEKICEGNGWYSKGEKITETIIYDFYWVVVLKNKCIGVVNQNHKKTLSKKTQILNFNGLKWIKNFVDNKNTSVKSDLIRLIKTHILQTQIENGSMQQFEIDGFAYDVDYTSTIHTIYGLPSCSYDQPDDKDVLRVELHTIDIRDVWDLDGEMLSGEELKEINNQFYIL
jgi:hypothetical protein